MNESGKKAFTETENINYVEAKATKKECFCVQYSMPIYKTVKAESKMYSFWTAFRVIYWTEKFMQEMHNFLFQQCKIWHFLINFFLQFILAIIHSPAYETIYVCMFQCLFHSRWHFFGKNMLGNSLNDLQTNCIHIKFIKTSLLLWQRA